MGFRLRFDSICEFWRFDSTLKHLESNLISKNVGRFDLTKGWGVIDPITTLTVPCLSNPPGVGRGLPVHSTSNSPVACAFYILYKLIVICFSLRKVKAVIASAFGSHLSTKSRLSVKLKIKLNNTAMAHGINDPESRLEVIQSR